MFNKLKYYLDEDIFFCFNNNDDNIEIVKYLSNTSMLDPEHSLYMRRENDHFMIYGKVRDESQLIISLKDKSIAYFYFCFLAKLSVNYRLDPKPLESDFEDDVDIDYAKSILKKYFSEDLYEVFSIKHEAVCLIEEENDYVVYYVNNEGEKFVISNDFDSFGLAAGVLFNYVWDFMKLKSFAEEWNLDIDKNRNEYRKIIKNLMDVE